MGALMCGRLSDKVPSALGKRIVVFRAFSFSGGTFMDSEIFEKLSPTKLGEYVVPIFVKPEDTELLAVSIVGMKLFSLSYLTGWIDMCFSSYFTALERPARSLITSFFGTLVFPIAFLFILSPIWKLNGVWLTSVFSCTASAILTIILAITMKHKKEIKSEET